MNHNEDQTIVVKEEKSLFCGLDLGQSADYSALSIIECIRSYNTWTGESEITKLNCVFLKRWALHSSYPSIVANVAQLMHSLKPYQSPDYKPVLAVDATGVGMPVVDLFRREKINCDLRPIQIVGGANVSQENGVFRVPKRDLVGAAQVSLQSRILKIAPQLPEAGTLIKELQNFKVKITDAGNDTYSAWRDSDHDDLVLSVAMAVWCANKAPFTVTEREKEVFRALSNRR